MKTIQPRNDPVAIFWRRVRLVTLFIVVVCAAFGVWDISKKEQESKTLRAQSEVALANLSKHQEDLRDQIRTLKSDRGMEGAVRDQYQMGKEGEGMIVIVNHDVPITAVEPTTTFKDMLHNVIPWW